jgi:hypothetical protein
MTEEVKKIKDKLDMVHINRDDFNKLIDDRIAYIYDSLCMRYIIAREKAALWDAYQNTRDGRVNRDRTFQQQQAERDVMKFIEILNDLIGEHK